MLGNVGPRVGYDPNTRTFGPLESSGTKKMETLTKTEESVSQLRVPIDLSSPKVLKNLEKQAPPKGEPIKSPTTGSGFLSGKTSLYPKFIDNVLKAQDQV